MNLDKASLEKFMGMVSDPTWVIWARSDTLTEQDLLSVLVS